MACSRLGIASVDVVLSKIAAPDRRNWIVGYFLIKRVNLKVFIRAAVSKKISGSNVHSCRPPVSIIRVARLIEAWQIII